MKLFRVGRAPLFVSPLLVAVVSASTLAVGASAVVGALAFTACAVTVNNAPTPSTPMLLVDATRDGTIDATTDAVAKATANAIVLPNLDDDSSRCPKDGTFDDLLACFDANDDVINGAEDAKDLSPMRLAPLTSVPDGATATLSATPAEKIHVFRKDTGALIPFGDAAFSAADLKAGVEFLVEATDLVHDSKVWDGTIEVAIETHDAAGKSLGRDTARFQVAPVIFQHHLNKAETIFVTDLGGHDGKDPTSEEGMSDTFENNVKADSVAAGAAFRKIAGRAGDNAVWNQDFWEPGYVSRPEAGGTEQTMRIVMMSSEKEAYDKNGKSLVNIDQSKAPSVAIARIDHAPRTKVTLQTVRGPDVAVATAFTVVDLTTSTWDQVNSWFEQDAFNYGGNTEVLPPFTNGANKYPFGRMLYGTVAGGSMDPAYDAFFGSQLQAPIHIDTSWLYVGHTDEFLSVIPAKNARGWALVVGDPKVTRKILQGLIDNGQGGLVMFKGKTFEEYDKDGNVSTVPADTTVADLLADKALAAANDTMIIEVEKQVATIQKEVGLTDDEILRIPAYHLDDGGKSGARMPDIVNGMLASPTVFMAPDPFGAQLNGKDVMKAATEAVFAPHGVTINWIDQWDYLHLALGEVHCGSNAFRAMDAKRWWETK